MQLKEVILLQDHSSVKRDFKTKELNKKLESESQMEKSMSLQREHPKTERYARIQTQKNKCQGDKSPMSRDKMENGTLSKMVTCTKRSNFPPGPLL